MKVIIIGCTHAGTFAAKNILKKDPKADVTIYEINKTVSYLSCGTALFLDGKIADPKGLFYSSPADLKKNGAHVEMQHKVEKVDSKNKTVTVKDLKSGQESTEHYDKLVMTSGSRPVIPPIKGIDNPKVSLCKNWDDAKHLFNAIPKIKSITIVGCGMIGAELAQSYSDRGKKVYLVDHQKRALGKYFDPKFTDVIEKLYQDHGVNLELDQKVQEISGDGPLTIKTNKGKTFKTDQVIMCVGFRPNTNLLQGQVKMDRGAIVTDRYQRTSNPDIFAAGDSAMSFYNPIGKRAYVALATNAVRQGILVGDNILKPRVKSIGCQASSGLKLYGMTTVSTGLTKTAAKKNGINAHQVIAKVNYRPAFMPTTTPVLMSVVYDPKDGRIIGGAFMSKHDVSLAASALSVMIQDHDTINYLSMVDMLFQPYFDAPLNFMNILGQTAVAHEAK